MRRKQDTFATNRPFNLMSIFWQRIPRAHRNEPMQFAHSTPSLTVQTFGGLLFASVSLRILR